MLPVSKGGSDDEDNLVAACWDCNHGKMVKNAFSNIPSQSFDEWKTEQEEGWRYPFDSMPEFPNGFCGKPFFMQPLQIDFDVNTAAADQCEAESVYSMTPIAVIRKSEAF